MKSNRRLALLVAVSIFLVCRQVPADSPVTFELVASFDYPGSFETLAFGINDRGVVAGYYGANLNPLRGFLRFADGHFSDPIAYGDGNTLVTGINNSGAICGSYEPILYTYHGFLLSGSTFTDIHVSSNTFLFGLNDAGNFCGESYDQPFVSIDGTVTFFDVMGTAVASANGINNLNRVIGTAVQGFPELVAGFRREVDGVVTWPVTSSPNWTHLNGVNDKRQMVGSQSQGQGPSHGIFYHSLNKSALYDYPGATNTIFTGINNRGLICGTYWDEYPDYHGFIVHVSSAPDE